MKCTFDILLSQYDPKVIITTLKMFPFLLLRLYTFNVIMQMQRKKFSLMHYLDIQVNKVDPVMDEKSQRFSGKPVSHQIVKYYKSNHIKKFQYSRPFSKKDPKISSDNEFAHLWIARTFVEIKQPLPGILRWSPIENVEVVELSPLRTAIETMDNTNKELKNLVLEYNREKNKQLHPLTMKINGNDDNIKWREFVFFYC